VVPESKFCLSNGFRRDREVYLREGGCKEGCSAHDQQSCVDLGNHTTDQSIVGKLCFSVFLRSWIC